MKVLGVQQALLGRTHWNADSLRDIVRDYIQETLGDEVAVLVIDETGFLKKGKASCCVGRQYTGSAGMSDWCICSLCLSAGSCFFGSSSVSS